MCASRAAPVFTLTTLLHRDCTAPVFLSRKRAVPSCTHPAAYKPPLSAFHSALARPTSLRHRSVAALPALHHNDKAPRPSSIPTPAHVAGLLRLPLTQPSQRSKPIRGERQGRETRLVNLASSQQGPGCTAPAAGNAGTTAA